MIYILVNIDLIDNFAKISDNRSKFIRYLSKDKEITMITHHNKNDNNFEYSQNVILVHYLMGPGASSIDKQFVIKPDNISNVLQLLWIEDFQHVDHYDSFIKQVDGIILSVHHSYYANEYKKKYPKIYISQLDHYLDNSIFKPPIIRSNKIYDIIFYGYIDKQYPFRQRLYKMLKNTTKYKIMWIPHPGYHNLSKVKNIVVGKKLAQLLSQSKLSICTSSKYKIIVKKYFETAMSDCLPCGDLPDDYRDVFGDYMVEISPDMSDSEILNKIDKALTLTDTEYIDRCQSLQKLINTKYNYSNGKSEFIKTVKSIHGVYSR